MSLEPALPRLAALLKRLRRARGVSRCQLADEVGVNPSVVSRAERGKDAQVSTWDKLFEGLGYRLLIDVAETSEEAGDLLALEAGRRRERRLEGLCSGKRRYW